MQFMTDDNMDELFRRAANDYPLNTDSADWEKLTAMQTKNAAEDSNSGKEKKKSYRKYLWLLLLLPMIWICNGRYFMNDSKQSEDNVSIKQIEQQKKSQEVITEKNENKNSDVASKKINSTTDKNASANASVTKSVSSATKNNVKKEQRVQIADATVLNKSETKINKISKPGIAKNRSNGFVKLNKTNNQKNKSTSFNNKKDKLPNPVVETNKTEDNIVDADTKTKLAENNETKESESNPEKTELKKDITNKNNKADNSSKAIDVKSQKNDSAQKQITQIAQQKTNKQSAKNKIHALYAGFVGGFDVSTVEFQSVKTTGYTAGILLGYQLNKKLSIESGLLWDKKYYYTNGKYFDPKNLNLPLTAYILNANGNCNMFELPINIKYNWTSTAKSNWFSTLGLSTYFMKKENYDYTYEYPGWTQQGNKTYNNATTNWFSVINVSGGYMHTLGKAGSLRVEPYLKIPVQGLGIGSLSIWSTGVYVSFVKNIFTR
jgi:hypothetical protein